MKKRPILPYASIFAIILVLDQYTKFLVTEFPLGQQQLVFQGLWLTYIKNTGALWGHLQGANTAFIWLSIIAFGLLLYFHEEFKTRTEKIAYALLLAGVWGNLIDRIVRGFVVDFIDLGWWPVFNIADSAICVGIGLYVFESWRKNRS